MLHQLFLIGFYPFWFATGLFPRSSLSIKPKASLLYAYVAYWLMALLHWWPVLQEKALVGISMNWLLAITFCKPRWQVAILLAWAATDAIAICLGWHWPMWDWILLAMYSVRSFFDEGEKNV